MKDEGMNSLLQNARRNINNLLQFKSVFVTLGNESCDLDSAISSLVYSLFLHHLETSSESIVIPLLNVSRTDFPIKTEVIYLLKKHEVNLDSIICRNEIDLNALQEKQSLRLTLVDHHVLQPADEHLKASVISVIDHRPQDPEWTWSGIDLTLTVVASCCTLIADKLLSQSPQLISPTIATWLLGTILVDSGCLSPSVGKATSLDHRVVAQLSDICKTFGISVDVNQIYAELMAAKSDISSLTAAQLLVKDLKMAAGIPIAGLPVKVNLFLQREDARDAAEAICFARNIDTCIIYGQSDDNGTFTRDLAVFTPNNSDISLEVVRALMDCRNPHLKLEQQPCSLKGFTLFEQLNIKATRKQILPIVQQVGEKFLCK